VIIAAIIGVACVLGLYVRVVQAQRRAGYYERLWQRERDTPRNITEEEHKKLRAAYLHLQIENNMERAKLRRESNAWRDAWKNRAKTLPAELTRLLLEKGEQE
jgi:hypothetical protein